MKTSTKKLYLFLSACGGNWRNTIFVSCPDLETSPGFFMAVNRDGYPVIMEMELFHQMTGELTDPAECCGHLTQDAFKSIFAQYLLWHISSI